ncbi:MAG: gliding motility lipoprotein GldH [Mangrovibacterium sp.]
MDIMKRILFWGFCTLLLSSCLSKSKYESYHTLESIGWHKDSVLVFQVAFTDSQTPYKLYLNIRNRGTYEFSNIWLFINIESPDGQLLKDTVEFTLADQAGRWTGSGIGDLFDNKMLYKSNVYFPTPGEYKFSIQQGMRAKRLEGIHDVGILIDKQ